MALSTFPPSPPASTASTDVRPFILVPLYIYPSPGAWTPLFDAAATHRDVHFKVVVNPANGPGPAPLPDANYRAAIAQLAALPNVQVLGYVHCTYGTRPLAAIVDDLKVYAGWETASLQATQENQGSCADPDATAPEADAAEQLRVDGIFIDETPASIEHVHYLSSLTKSIRTTLSTTPSGVSSPHSPCVIFNPGVVVPAIFFTAAAGEPDYIVVFENCAAAFGNGDIASALASLTPLQRARSIAIAHSSALDDASGRGRAPLALGERISRDAGLPGQYVTTVEGYTAWCDGWEAYVRELEGWECSSTGCGGAVAGGEANASDKAKGEKKKRKWWKRW